jgi:hypothetical protein
MRRPFSAQEDALLVALVAIHGANDWAAVSAGLPGRTARQARNRWNDYLRPGRNTAPFTPGEDASLLAQVALRGRRWTAIAATTIFAGRTPTSLKNRWLVLSRRSPQVQGTINVVFDDSSDDQYGGLGDFGDSGGW